MHNVKKKNQQKYEGMGLCHVLSLGFGLMISCDLMGLSKALKITGIVLVALDVIMIILDIIIKREKKDIATQCMHGEFLFGLYMFTIASEFLWIAYKAIYVNAGYENRVLFILVIVVGLIICVIVGRRRYLICTHRLVENKKKYKRQYSTKLTVSISLVLLPFGKRFLRSLPDSKAFLIVGVVFIVVGVLFYAVLVSGSIETIFLIRGSNKEAEEKMERRKKFEEKRARKEEKRRIWKEKNKLH